MKQFKTDEEYYGDKEYVTNSQLGYLKKSPVSYINYIQNGGEETIAFQIGKLLHEAILEQDKFEERQDNNGIVLYEGVRRGKKWDEFNLHHNKDIILNMKEFNMLGGMIKSLRSNDEITELLSSAKKELVNCWMDDDTLVKCKGKADAVLEDTIIDVKTTTNVEFDKFRSSCYRYGYNRQAAFYSDGFNVQNFKFVCVEKEYPFRVAIYDCSPEFIESGRQEYKQLLETYYQYFIEKSKSINDYYLKGVL